MCAPRGTFPTSTAIRTIGPEGLGSLKFMKSGGLTFVASPATWLMGRFPQADSPWATLLSLPPDLLVLDVLCFVLGRLLRVIRCPDRWLEDRRRRTNERLLDHLDTLLETTLFRNTATVIQTTPSLNLPYSVACREICGCMTRVVLSQRWAGNETSESPKPERAATRL